MKKTLALLLALMMILTVSLTACSNGNNSNNAGDDFEEEDDGFVMNNGTQTEDTNDTDADTNNDTNNDGEWEAVNKTVYTMWRINLRAEADRESDSIITVDAKTALTVIAQTKVRETSEITTVWYKVSYNGQELCANSDYLTTNIDDTNFSTIELADQFDITVKADSQGNTQTVNLRTMPTYDKLLPAPNMISVSNVDTQTKPMTVVGKNDTGTWYMVKYDGKDYYLAITSGTKPYLDGIPSGGTSGDIIGG